MKNMKWIGVLGIVAVIGVGGCQGGGESNSAPAGGNAPNLSNMLAGLGNIPGVNSADLQKAQQGLQLANKGADLLSIDSPKRQDEIGQAVAVAISNKHPMSKDQDLNDYVNLVGLTVASVSPNPDINYAFGVLDTPQIGAYSAPGGYVFITKGAVDLCDDESELAAVLAHEVAHVALHHGIEAVKTAKGADFLMTAAKTQNDQLRTFSAQSDAFVDAIVVKGFSRDQESKADEAAVKYLVAAGYDPAGLTRFLKKLEAKTGSGGGARQVMSTHPGTAERVAAVTKQVQSLHTGGATLRQRFAANVSK